MRAQCMKLLLSMFKGAKPADPPVERARKLELILALASSLDRWGSAGSRDLINRPDGRRRDGFTCEVFPDSLKIPESFGRVVGLAALAAGLSLDGNQEAIASDLDLRLDPGQANFSGLADDALHGVLLRRSSGSHRAGSGWYTVMITSFRSAVTGAQTT